MKAGRADPEKSSSSSFQSLDYFKDISVSKIKQLYEYYRYDFEIFDYSAEEYLDKSWLRCYRIILIKRYFVNVYVNEVLS